MNYLEVNTLIPDFMIGLNGITTFQECFEEEHSLEFLNLIKDNQMIIEYYLYLYYLDCLYATDYIILKNNENLLLNNTVELSERDKQILIIRQQIRAEVSDYLDTHDLQIVQDGLKQISISINK